MHSSTSNSDARIPSGPWSRTWLLAIALCLSLLGCYEATWRSIGFTPSIHDTPEAWAVVRRSVGRESVVFVGSSRLQAAVDPGIWSEEWRRDVVQLAIIGAASLPVLEDLAADRSFAGTVIVDALPRIMFDAGGTREELVVDWLGASRKVVRSPARLFETRLRLWLTGHVVSSRLAPWEFFARGFLRSDIYRIPYVTMRDDRFMQLDFRRVIPGERVSTIQEQILEHAEPATPEGVQATIRRIAVSVDSIRARGGEVLLVHMPHGGRIRALEEELYPRAAYWDELAAAEVAPAVHYADYPELAEYECPDGSHIDVADTAAFTRALAAIARERLDAARRSAAGAR